MFYEHFSDSYDDMINWDHRFQAEFDHIKTLFSENGIKSVIDVGCGTGMHAVLFSKMGVKVTGVDNNDSMLEKAYENLAKYQVDKVTLKKGEMLKLGDVIEKDHDCLVCLGNTLPHLTDDEEVVEALKEFYSVIKPGGLCLLQMVNFDHYLDCADSAVAVNDGMRNGQRVTFRRHYEFKGTKVIFHVSIFDRARRELLENYSTPLNAIRKDLLETFMERAGFRDISMHANFDRSPIEPKDRSFIVFATRPLEEEQEPAPEEE